jgi:hypothetical protein
MTDIDDMRRIAFPAMSLGFTARAWPRVLCLALMLALLPVAFAVDAAPGDKDAIVSTTPMEIVAEGSGAHGHLVVAPEIVSADTRADLIYTITTEPKFGRVGLAGGGDETDIFKNKTARLGYFAYRSADNYAGEDSFAYSVRNETTGLVYKNTVKVTVKPAPPIMLEKFEVGAARERNLNVRAVSLATRPNISWRPPTA